MRTEQSQGDKRRKDSASGRKSDGPPAAEEQLETDLTAASLEPSPSDELTAECDYVPVDPAAIERHVRLHKLMGEAFDAMGGVLSPELIDFVDTHPERPQSLEEERYVRNLIKINKDWSDAYMELYLLICYREECRNPNYEDYPEDLSHNWYNEEEEEDREET